MRPISMKIHRPLFSFLLASSLLITQVAWAESSSVTAVALEAGENEMGAVSVELDSVPVYSASVDKAAKRLFVDFRGARLQGPAPAIVEGKGVVGGVSAQTYDNDNGTTTRLTVSLTKEAQYSISVDGNRLSVRFEKGPLQALTGLDAKMATVRKAQGSRREPAIGNVSYVHKSGRDTVEIELDARARFRLDNLSNGRSRLIIRGAQLPERLARTLDVAEFGGSVHTVSSYKERADVVFEVQRDTGATSSVERHGNSLRWMFYEPGTLPSSLTGYGRDGLPARRAQTIAGADDFPDLPDVKSGAEGFFQIDTDESDEASAFGPGVVGQAAGYSGRRIDLDLKDADIHNVLRLIGDVSRRNIIVTDDVSGSVTIRLRNVPWDQALAVILQSKKLGMVEQGNMIRIAPLDRLQKEREMEIARRKTEVRLAPIETRLIPVSYATASGLQQRVAPLLSDRGSISIDDRTNTIIARDVAVALDQIEELVRALDTQTPQVLVEARIIEATSRYSRDVGIQWGGAGTASSVTGNPTGLVFPSSVSVAGGATDGNTPTQGLSAFSNSVANPNFAVNLPAAIGAGAGGALGFTFGSIDNNVNLALRLSAAETSGMLRILSSPRVLTLDNTAASITQGTLIPYSQVSAQGVQTAFQNASLELQVTPHVTADGSVHMSVNITRNEPDFNNTGARGDPTILKRSASTELLVMDGHTAVIGGIFTRSTGRSVDQVPFFGDIPILGLLFQRRRANDNRGELVIFITPRIVNRAEALGR